MSAQQVVLDRGRVYVIGDIHGRADLLERMIALIASDLKNNPRRDCLTVTLGDYIDRGLDSRGVINRLARNPFPTDFIALKGNHEELLRTFIHDPAVAEDWRRLGGLETLHSYGVPVSRMMMGEDFEKTANALRKAMPDEHFRFLASLQTSVMVGKYFLCHAGVRPGISLERQSVDDLLWIRDEFLNSKVNFGRIVVHGHTPTAQPEILPNRINIDTGAYATGRLTCAVLENSKPRFLMTA